MGQNHYNSSGKFDRAAQGQRTKTFNILINEQDIVNFAAAIGSTNSANQNVSALKTAGSRTIVAPPTFATYIDMAAIKGNQRLQIPSVFELVNANFQILLHGEEEYSYNRPIISGELVSHETLVVGFSDAAGGKIEIAHLETSITSKERGKLVTAKRNLIHNLSLKGER